MSHQDDDLLGRALRDHADQVGGHPLDLDAVKGRARGIRRRRRVATGLAGAAVLAVALPVGLVVGDRLTGAPIDPANPSPAPTRDADPTPAPTPSTGPDRLDTLDLPRGDDARIDYLRDGTLVSDEGEVDLGGGSIYDAGRFAGGWYKVVGGGGGAPSLVLLDADLAETDRFTISGDVALSVSRGVIAFATPAGQVRAAYDGPASPVDLGAVSGNGLDVVALTGSDDCVEAGDCQAFVTVDQPGPQTRQVDGQGEGTPVAADGRPYLYVADATPDGGRLVGMVSIDELEPGSCSVLVDRTSGDSWETCDVALDALSPDGSSVSAGDAFSSGIGNGELAVLDAATGEERWHVVRRREADPFFTQSVWEDDEHLLAVTHQQGTWSLVRFGLDGSAELAADPVEGDDLSNPFGLPTQP